MEYGFLDSSKDDVNQLKNNYRNLTEAVVRGVLEYINYETQPTTDSNVYLVRKGDSLWSIAKKYNMTVEELKNLNNLTSNLLNVGQTLKITGMPTTDNPIYIVKIGDTLYKIANQYGVTVDELKSYNNLISNTLSIGEQLYIPTGQITEDIIGPDYDTYIVQNGDTLYKIATNYNISLDRLRNINNLTTDTLSIGQQLLVPLQENIVDTEITNYINYRVNPNDTLYSISNQYGINIDELKQINNLTNNTIKPGQVLKIPRRETTVYTVKSGDTLYSIARTYNMTVDELKQINNLTTNTLSIGQILNVK